jgi:hypothetical protein
MSKFQRTGQHANGSARPPAPAAPPLPTPGTPASTPAAAAALLPDVVGAATKMDQHAVYLDQQAAVLADKASTIRQHARDRAEELIRGAQIAADELIAEEEARATPDADAAQQCRIDAEFWRGMAKQARTGAGLPEPETAPFGREFGTEAPQSWTDPKGGVWDLSAIYQDPSGQRWHYARSFGLAPGFQGEWPLFSHTDYGVTDIPLPQCPALRPVADAELTGPFPAAPAAGVVPIVARTAEPRLESA